MTGTTTDPVTSTADPSPRDAARDNAVRALLLALGQYTEIPAEVLEPIAANIVDIHLGVAGRPWVLLVESDLDCEVALAKAVLGTIPGNRTEPTEADLECSRAVIRTLIRP